MLQLVPHKVCLDVSKVRQILPEHRVLPSAKVLQDIKSVANDEQTDAEIQVRLLLFLHLFYILLNH
jgi:hypothetical protein